MCLLLLFLNTLVIGGCLYTLCLTGFTCIIDPLVALHNTTKGYDRERDILAIYATPDDIKRGPIDSHPQDSQIIPNPPGNIEHIPNYAEGLQVAGGQNTEGI